MVDTNVKMINAPHFNSSTSSAIIAWLTVLFSGALLEARPLQRFVGH
jgi:hypothetical protein